MVKKNKGGKSASARALRNLEALKKAKETVKAEEEAKTTEKETMKEQEQKQENPTQLTNFVTPVGKTVYETHMKCVKSPYMSLLSMKIEKDSKGIENIKSEWKNNETSDTTILMFPVSNVKEGDGIDIERIRNGIKNPIPAKLPEEQSSAKETKEEKPKNQKVKIKVKTKKEEVLVPEEVSDEDIVDKVPTIKQQPRLQHDNADRIDANRSVDLMNALLKRREEIKDRPELSEQYKASGQQADIMMWALLQKWNNQLIDDAQSNGIKVNTEMFDYLNSSVSMFLGVNLIGKKTEDGQLAIDFNQTISQTSPQMQKALQQDAEATSKEKKTSNNSNEMPKLENCVTDEDKLSAIRSIMYMRHSSKENSIGINLTNAIEFSRKAFQLGDETTPAKILATTFKKFEQYGQATGMFEGIANAVQGNLSKNLSNLAAHGWLKSKLPNYDDKIISDMVKIFIAKKAEEEARFYKKNPEQVAKGYSMLLGSLTDDLINRTMKSAKNEGKDQEKLQYQSQFKEIPSKTGSHIEAVKTINSIKLAYGTEMSEKLLLQKMKQVNALYVGTNIQSLDKYVEKSAYAKK